MKLSTKRALDHRLGSICLYGFSWAVRALGAVLRRNHETLPIDCVVILKFQGMGSLAIAKPAIASLRARHPETRIVFWGTRSTGLVAREMPEFDEVLVLDERDLVRAAFSTGRSLLRLYRLNPDWAIDLEVYSKLSVLLCTLTCARNRAGFAVDTVRLRRVNHTHLVFFNRHRYLGQAYERLLGLLDAGSEAAEVNYTHSWAERAPSRPGASIPVDREYVVINPNAGELRLERRWPIAHFQELIEALLERYPDLEVVLIGAGAEEAEYCGRLAGHPRVIDLVDRLSLREVLDCIERARLVISNDSAALHFALLSSVPVVGLFGPTHPTTYVSPDRPRTRIHYGAIYCSPCVHYWEPPPCKGWNQCMMGIPVERVLRSCIELLAEEPPRDLRLIDSSVVDENVRYYPGLVYARQRDRGA